MAAERMVWIDEPNKDEAGVDEAKEQVNAVEGGGEGRKVEG